MGFSMETADAQKIKVQVAEEILPTDTEKSELINMTKINTESITNLDLNSLEERHQIVKSIDDFGMETMKMSADKNTILQSKFMGIDNIWGGSSSIISGLLSLNTEMKKLDPGDIDFGASGILGKIFNPMKAYFEKYRRADESIDNIIRTLDNGRSILKNDNVTLEIEEMSLKKITSRLSKEIELGAQMNDEITKILQNSSANNIDEEKYKFISEEILYPLQQRLFDLNQLLIVNQQGIVSIEVLLKNNKELIRGIDRAKTVTITALKTAVIVAGSLYNQKLVLKKIQSLGKMTDSIMTGTATLLNQQGTAIAQTAAGAGSVSIESLKTAFEETFEALDVISGYRAQALESMDHAVHEFKMLKDANYR